jgi:SMI1 / KNR4 family (SUKH-1)
MNELLLSKFEKLFVVERKGLALERIEQFEEDFEIKFPEDFKEYLLYIDYGYCKVLKDFALIDGLLVNGFTDLYALENKRGNNWLADTLEFGECMEDQESFYHFGQSAFSTEQMFFIGVKEGSFFGKIYLWNYKGGDGDRPLYQNDEGVDVFPKHFVADSFEEFLDLMMEIFEENF